MEISQMNFPVITFSKSNAVYFARNENDLAVCNNRGLKNGFHSGLVIVDSEGNQVKVKEARKIGNVGAFFGYNIFLEQKIRVVLIFDNRQDKIDLKGFKERILRSFNGDISFWDSDGQLESRIAFVQKAESINEIIQRLTLEFYKTYK